MSISADSCFLDIGDAYLWTGYVRIINNNKLRKLFTTEIYIVREFTKSCVDNWYTGREDYKPNFSEWKQNVSKLAN